ncbi:nucleotidyltransferase family protein [Rhizobium leguminosarum]|uniref:nucleotidyltransferase family protein n=1 Tax=Rhizobium leguminosarum TaxID=384 RepID=UPI003F9A447B
MPDEALLTLLLTASDDEVRGTLASLARSRRLAELYDLAERNDLSYCLLERLKRAEVDAVDKFTPPPDDGGILGYLNASADLLRQESLEVASILRAEGHNLCLVKGATVGELYPEHVHRHQNDFDIATRSEEDFFELARALLHRGYLPRVFAIRLSERNTLEGSLSAVRIDTECKQTLWCDIWIGVQPVNRSRARKFPVSFWQALVPLKTGEPAPAISSRITILVNEVEERGILRLKDLIDFAVLSSLGHRAQPSEAAGADCNWKLFNLLRGATKELTPSVGRLMVGTPLGSSRHSIELRYPISVSEFAEPVSEHEAPLVRFLAVSSERGRTACSEAYGRLVIRTPFGTFASELSYDAASERFFRSKDQYFGTSDS